MNTRDKSNYLAGRILIALIFILAGASKTGAGYAGAQAYMASQGIPGGLLPLVIGFEIGGGIAVALGLFTRPMAFMLAGFCIVTAIVFHAEVGKPEQFVQFFKSLAMSGGLLFLCVHGAGPWSIDERRHSA